MHARRILQQLIAPVTHLKRLSTLTLLVEAVLTGKRLTVTQLGRDMKTHATERSAIRMSDRLIGNQGLHRERHAIYQQINQAMLGNRIRPWIIIDWTPVPNQSHHVLRASCVTKGRALTLYEQCHPERELGNAKVQQAFIKTLKGLLPAACCPIVITDAGFSNDWFKTVMALGWDYVGRVRGKKCFRAEGEQHWHSCKVLTAGGLSTPEYLGKVTLAKSRPFETALYRVNKRLKGRKALNRRGLPCKGSHSRQYAKGQREAWLLATSLPHRSTTAKRVVEIYESRMQIEEGFRDLKSSEYGFGMEKSRSKSLHRIENLLLVAMLASWVAWLLGYLGEQQGYQRQFQANSTRHKRVLSLFYLGCQMMKRQIRFTSSQYTEAIEAIGKITPSYFNDKL